MKFETKNANYDLHPAYHFLRTKKKGLEDFDAIVLESGLRRYENSTLFDLRDNRQYKKIISKAEEKKKPLYFVDVPPISSSKYFSLKDAIRLKIVDGATSSLVLPFVSNLLSYANFIEPVAEINSYLVLSNFCSPVGFRSAISARKIEENIAPAIRKRKGEKPNIFVEYGGGHIDMKHYLQRKWLMDSVIKLHSFWDYYPLEKKYLNLIKEISLDDNPLNLGEKVSCFDYGKFLMDGHKEIIYKIT